MRASAREFVGLSFGFSAGGKKYTIAISHFAFECLVRKETGGGGGKKDSWQNKKNKLIIIKKKTPETTGGKKQ